MGSDVGGLALNSGLPAHHRSVGGHPIQRGVLGVALPRGATRSCDVLAVLLEQRDGLAAHAPQLCRCVIEVLGRPGLDLRPAGQRAARSGGRTAHTVTVMASAPSESVVS
jgi:hypothetical protein